MSTGTGREHIERVLAIIQETERDGLLVDRRDDGLSGISGLKTVGVTRMDIFLHERRLFMYMETTDGFDLERDFPRYMESPRAKEWDALMRTFQEPVQDAAPGEWWAAMEHVFDLNR